MGLLAELASRSVSVPFLLVINQWKVIIDMEDDAFVNLALLSLRVVDWVIFFKESLDFVEDESFHFQNSQIGIKHLHARNCARKRLSREGSSLLICFSLLKEDKLYRFEVFFSGSVIVFVHSQLINHCVFR